MTEHKWSQIPGTSRSQRNQYGFYVNYSGYFCSACGMCVDGEDGGDSPLFWAKEELWINCDLVLILGIHDS